MILPASSKTQSHDQLSPISTPIVSFCSLKISLPNTCTVLIFFIAGLLLCLEHVFHWERIASRWRPAFSSHLSNQQASLAKFLAPVTRQRRSWGYRSHRSRCSCLCPCVLGRRQCRPGFARRPLIRQCGL